MHPQFAHVQTLSRALGRPDQTMLTQVSLLLKDNLIKDNTVCDSNQIQTNIPMRNHNILAYKTSFKSSCTATL